MNVNRYRPILVAALAAVFLSCTPANPTPPQAPGGGTGVRWAYQLQNINPDELAASRFDVLVIDYADDDGIPFPAAQIARLQANGKTVLSYLSIGEAESYRPYWNPAWVEDTGDECSALLSDSAPYWLEPANPDWCGNYKVQFWAPEWQAITFDYLDEILAAGFDGAYLDIVDAFYYWIGEEDLGASFVNPDAAVDMFDFVAAIDTHARAVDGDFLIVPQNAPEIIEYLDAGQAAAYLDLIDAIGVEDTFFYSDNVDENAPYNPQDYVLDLLVDYQAAGVTVYAVDYVTRPGKVERFYQEALARGFIPYATVRELDRLTDLEPSP